MLKNVHFLPLLLVAVFLLPLAGCHTFLEPLEGRAVATITEVAKIEENYAYTLEFNVPRADGNVKGEHMVLHVFTHRSKKPLINQKMRIKYSCSDPSTFRSLDQIRYED